eukprot:scaffold21994_cov71-Phaeocystis_antarctica.AAC.5
MASARFLTSADASHPAAAISRSCACESSARRSAIRETGSMIEFTKFHASSKRRAARRETGAMSACARTGSAKLPARREAAAEFHQLGASGGLSALSS